MILVLIFLISVDLLQKSGYTTMESIMPMLTKYVLRRMRLQLRVQIMR